MIHATIISVIVSFATQISLETFPSPLSRGMSILWLTMSQMWIHGSKVAQLLIFLISPLPTQKGGRYFEDCPTKGTFPVVEPSSSQISILQEYLQGFLEATPFPTLIEHTLMVLINGDVEM